MYTLEATFDRSNTHGVYALSPNAEVYDEGAVCESVLMNRSAQRGARISRTRSRCKGPLGKKPCVRSQYSSVSSAESFADRTRARTCCSSAGDISFKISCINNDPDMT